LLAAKYRLNAKCRPGGKLRVLAGKKIVSSQTQLKFFTHFGTPRQLAASPTHKLTCSAINCDRKAAAAAGGRLLPGSTWLGVAAVV
jgi:hypothetical protein